jgi:hypothetical protein
LSEYFSIFFSNLGILHLKKTKSKFKRIFSIIVVEKLVPHAYITQEQVKYLTERKDNFTENDALVLMDFAMGLRSKMKAKDIIGTMIAARCI